MACGKIYGVTKENNSPRHMISNDSEQPYREPTGRTSDRP